jgi:SAM-dependent methyltransferase
MSGYSSFAPFYDAVQGDGAERAGFVRELIQNHCPSAQTVLELACGTGSILEQLQESYMVTGLDLSPQMLEVAREKVPRARLIESDMTTFRLDENFDVVLCVYDSISHLLDWSQWEAVFDRAHEHLNSGGIFIFDINTKHRLAALCEYQPAVRWFGDRHLLVMDVKPSDKEAVVTWRLRIFEHLGKSRYGLHEADIDETSFPCDQIAESLRKRFRRVGSRDPERQRRSAASGRLYFIAKK